MSEHCTRVVPPKQFVRTTILMVLISIAGIGCSEDGNNAVVPDVHDPMKYDPVLYGLIPAGSFLMGDTSAYAMTHEQPLHRVTITRPFLMGRTEVTQAQYFAVMARYPSHFFGANNPVEMVSWSDAVEYCNALSRKEGLTPCFSDTGIQTKCDWSANGYRLPTEAEWEYACRAGTTTDFYTGRLVYPVYYPPDPSLDFAGVYGGNSRRTTHPVGKLKANGFGLFDMHGNVAEWCWDAHSFQYYALSPGTDPQGPEADSIRVLRGGCWFNTAVECRSSYRSGLYYFRPTWLAGFRVVRTYK